MAWAFSSFSSWTSFPLFVEKKVDVIYTFSSFSSWTSFPPLVSTLNSGSGFPSARFRAGPRFRSALRADQVKAIDPSARFRAGPRFRSAHAMATTNPRPSARFRAGPRFRPYLVGFLHFFGWFLQLDIELYLVSAIRLLLSSILYFRSSARYRAGPRFRQSRHRQCREANSLQLDIELDLVSA